MRTFNQSSLVLGLAASLTALAALSAGCGDPGAGGGVQGGNCAPAVLNLSNTTTESIEVDVSGPEFDSTNVAPGQTGHLTIPAGAYEVRVSGLTSGQVLSDVTTDFACGQVASSAISERNSELDLTNATADNLWVTIDGELQNMLEPGQTAQYVMPAGQHQIKVEEDGSGTVLWDDAASNTAGYYAPGQVYPFTLTANDQDPIIEIVNQLPAGGDCVTATVNAPSSGNGSGNIVFWDDTVQQNTGEICPGEVGYFAVYQGTSSVELDDQRTAQVLMQVTQDYYNNTTTEYDVK